MLLFDQNLSFRLGARLADLFPGAEHVASAGLAEATDDEVWQFAQDRSLHVVTKDSDFNDLAVLTGAPPHVVWIQRGNRSTDDIERLLRLHAKAVASLSGTEASVLILA